jgi:hypothetical protein
MTWAHRGGWTEAALDYAHMQTRMARKLPSGNYVVPQLLDKVVREYTPGGKIVWEAKTLLFGTDPVAVDRIELEIVEKKRREVGAPSLWDRNPANLGTSADMQRTAHKNPFYHEPGHIKTASELGLGTWDLDRIDHKRLQLG